MTCHYLCPFGPETLGSIACQDCENAIDNLDSTKWLKALLADLGWTVKDEEPFILE